MKKRRIITGIVVVAAIGAIIAGWVFSLQNSKVTVGSVEAATGTLAVTVAASGKLVAPNAVTVSAPTSGTLATVRVSDGQAVKKGDLLATMDVAPLDLAVTRAEAELAAARALPTGTTRLNESRNAATKAAEAALDAARSDRTDARIKAPASGSVQLTASLQDSSVKQARDGASVSAGTTLFTIVDLSKLQFEAQVDEADIAGVEPKLAAEVTLDSFPAGVFPGKVKSVGAVSVTTTTGGIAFPVLITLDAPGVRLLAGMSGDARIDIATVEGALVIPANTIIVDGTQRFVWRIENGKVHRTPVQIGASSDTQAQVTSGLEQGDVLATGNLTELVDGASVNVSG